MGRLRNEASQKILDAQFVKETKTLSSFLYFPTNFNQNRNYDITDFVYMYIKMDYVYHIKFPFVP